MKNSDFPLAALFTGGGQERRLRGGTENVSGIVGFGVAVEFAVKDMTTSSTIRGLRDLLESRISSSIATASIIGRDVDRLPNTVCVAVPGLETRTQVMALDLDGIMVGAGAACSSGKMGESQVLKAMGLDHTLISTAIRLSLGWASTSEDIERFLESWIALGRRKGLPIVDAAAAA
jgi:cysteine desulfurase